MITIQVNIDGAIHILETAAEHATFLDKPLKLFGEYLKKKAGDRLKAGNFAPLSSGTTHARVLKGLARVESKLHIDLRKAVKRATTAQLGEQSVLNKMIRSVGGGGKFVPEDTKGTRNRTAVISEFQRRNRRQGLHGKFSTRSQIAESAQKLTLKQHASLTNRTRSAIKKAVSKQILGRISQILEVKVDYGDVSVKSKSTKEWTEVHNTGGTVGHGSKIPQRQYLLVEEDDLAILEGLIKEHVLEPLVK